LDLISALLAKSAAKCLQNISNPHAVYPCSCSSRCTKLQFAAFPLALRISPLAIFLDASEGIAMTTIINDGYFIIVECSLRSVWLASSSATASVAVEKRISWPFLIVKQKAMDRWIDSGG